MKNYSINLKNSTEANTAIHLFEKLGGRCKSDKLDFTGFLYLIDGVISERITYKDMGRADIEEVTFDALKCLTNPDQLIGRKVRGFKFEPTAKCDYAGAMNKFIGEIGEIIEYQDGCFCVHFKYECNYWYPEELIHEHLVEEIQPKFPKVWAWDDDVSEAFETYLIDENKEKDFPFLCVRIGNVHEFEVFCDFHVSPYKNISPTDPRLNDIITVVEKYGKDFVIKTVEEL